jgi:hypothetical protein
MNDWDIYQTAYQAADQKTKSTLHSSLIPECVTEAVKKYELDASHQKTLVGLFSKKILQIVTDGELIEQMKTAGIPSASTISSEISQCLSTKKPTVLDTSLVSGEGTDSEVAESVNTSAQPTDAPSIPAPEASQTPDSSLDSDIEETEAAFNAIPKIRTMVQDAQESPTHTSSQSQLLDRSNRWDKKPQ